MSESVTIPRTSEYATTPVYRSGQDLVLGLRRASILPDPSDRILEVKQAFEGRLDLVAYDVYQDVNLWWVIADLNKIVDPMTELRAGLRIRIPSPARVRQAIINT